jgi:hypothetical protein
MRPSEPALLAVSLVGSARARPHGVYFFLLGSTIEDKRDLTEELFDFMILYTLYQNIYQQSEAKYLGWFAHINYYQLLLIALQDFGNPHQVETIGYNSFLIHHSYIPGE